MEVTGGFFSIDLTEVDSAPVCFDPVAGNIARVRLDKGVKLAEQESVVDVVKYTAPYFVADLASAPGRDSEIPHRDSGTQMAVITSGMVAPLLDSKQ